MSEPLAPGLPQLDCFNRFPPLQVRSPVAFLRVSARRRLSSGAGYRVFTRETLLFNQPSVITKCLSFLFFLSCKNLCRSDRQTSNPAPPDPTWGPLCSPAWPRRRLRGTDEQSMCVPVLRCRVCSLTDPSQAPSAVRAGALSASERMKRRHFVQSQGGSARAVTQDQT